MKHLDLPASLPCKFEFDDECAAAHTSLVSDARRSLENANAESMATDFMHVLDTQRDLALELISTIDPSELSHKIMQQVVLEYI